MLYLPSPLSSRTYIKALRDVLFSRYLFVMLFCHFSTTWGVICFSRAFMPASLFGSTTSMLMLPTKGSWMMLQSSSGSAAARKVPLVCIMGTFTVCFSFSRKLRFTVISTGNLFSQVPVHTMQKRDKAPRWLLRKCSQNRFTLTFESCGLGVTAGDWFQWSLN